MQARRIHPLFKPNRDLSECIKHEKTITAFEKIKHYNYDRWT